MKPSDTPSGQAWLANFDKSDLEAATALLDSLRFVGLDTLRNELITKLEALRVEKKIGEPAVLLPERKLKDLEEEGGPPLDKRTAVAYTDFHPGAKISSTPGSEGIIGIVLRDFAVTGSDDPANPWIAPDALLDQLRERHCRSIVLVTDYCGTGSQVSILADTLARNKTIKSWRSLKLVRIHVLAFAASPLALRALDSHPAVDAVHTIEAARTFDDAPWSKELRGRIDDLCRRKNRIKGYSLGYEASGGLFATGRRAPNNLPAVLWQQAEDWNPLFPWRKVSPEVAADLDEYRPSEPLPALAARVGQPRVSRNRRLEYMRPASRRLLGVLLAVHRSAKTPAELAAELSTPVAEMEALLGTLHRLGLVDKQFGITPEGRREILAQKRALRRTTAGLERSDVTYYPHSLR
jgi:hypothetical protein